MALRVSQYGDPVLKKVTENVLIFDKALQSFIDALLDTMKVEEGIGLAAPQVGDLRRILVIDVTPCLQGELPVKTCFLDQRNLPADIVMPLIMINPVYEAKSKDSVTYEEGCLSIPGVNATVERPILIKVSYQDSFGNSHNIECDGILSRCIQHEIDHLEGKLFIDYLTSRELQRHRTKLKKLRRATRDWLKIS